MFKLKRKIDPYFIGGTLLIAIGNLFFDDYRYIGICLLIGVIFASIAVEKDIRHANGENFDKVAFNLIINLGLYAVAFLLGYLLESIIGLVAAGIGVIIYRKVYFNSLSKSLKEEGGD